MKHAWKRSRVPIIGVIGIFVVTLIAFASVRPELLEVHEPTWTITGNAIVDDTFFDSKITTTAQCTNLDDPVCGANGETYRNLCQAHKAGTDMKYKGACSGWVKE